MSTARGNAPREDPLEEVRIRAINVLSDLLTDDDLDRLAACPAHKAVTDLYLHSDCDDFAIALHRITGWRILSITSPERGTLHRLVVSPGRRMIDASGWVEERDIHHRYGTRRPLLVAQGGEELALGSTIDDMEGDIDESLRLAVMAIRNLPFSPFVDADFRMFSMRPVSGVDFPRRKG